MPLHHGFSDIHTHVYTFKCAIYSCNVTSQWFIKLQSVAPSIGWHRGIVLRMRVLYEYTYSRKACALHESLLSLSIPVDCMSSFTDDISFTCILILSTLLCSCINKYTTYIWLISSRWLSTWHTSRLLHHAVMMWFFEWYLFDFLCLNIYYT